MRLAMVAGEASGDLLAGLLLKGLKSRWPTLEAAGIGGPRMAEEGFEAWWPHDKLAVRGYVEVLRHYREISGIRTQLKRRLLAEPPRAFIGVDAPDFNLGLEHSLRDHHIPTVHFVCPSIWAWRGGRAKHMARSCDLVLCLFPFEPELLQRHGCAARYVGHPLADALPLEPPREACRAALGIDSTTRVVAVLPGSRRSEIEYIAPTFLQAVSEMHRRAPDMQFVLPVSTGLRPMLEPMVARWAPSAPLRLLDGQSHAALAACDVTLIASGTATLEAALFKRPMVIGYRMNAWSWQLMRRMRYQPWVGLPNILCANFEVPELLQDECSPLRLADETLRWLDDAASTARVVQRFHDLHLLLRRDTAQRATDAIAQIVGA